MSGNSKKTYRIQNDVPVPMRDGVRLAARVFVPEEAQPCPVIVNMMPYHKDGIYSVGYVDAMNRYLAERGYVMITADLRGTGASEGHVDEAFAYSERFDGYDLVEWAAGQPWSTGAVGMWGLSYGGITALSTASLNPPSLRAIVPIHAAADMYGDYLHSHGCRTAFSPDVHWGIRMAASLALPPLSTLQGVDGGTMWRDRFANFRPWIVDWHDDADDEEAWSRRIADVSDIRAATYVVGGWRDIFADVAVRMFQSLAAPRKLLLGPWKHIFPDLAAVAPIGFSSEMERWFDRWLKGLRNGIETEPAVAYYVYGRDEWWSSDCFPPPNPTARVHDLLASPVRYRYTPLAGADTITMHWLAGPDSPQYPSTDDAFTVALDTQLFGEPTVLAGTVSVALRGTAEVDDPPIVVRLFELHEDGRRTFITMGWQRCAFFGEAEIAMRPIAYEISAGSRLRLTVSCADVSRIWPETSEFSFAIETVVLHLPIATEECKRTSFLPPGIAASTRVRSDRAVLTVARSALRQELTLKTMLAQTYSLESGATIATELDATLTIDAEAPQRSRLDAVAVYVLRRNGTDVRTSAVLEETLDQIRVAVNVTDGNEDVYHKMFAAPVKKPLSQTQARIQRVAKSVSDKIES